MLGNLLVIVNDFPTEGNSRARNVFVKNQVIALRKYFKNVYVVVPFPAGLEYIRKVNYKNYSYENIHVYFLKYINPLFPVTWQYLRELWIYLEARRIIRFVKEENISFDLINAHYSWPSGAVSTELNKHYHAPLIITEHTHLSLYPLINKKDRIIVRTWSRADALVRVCKKDIPLLSSICAKEKIAYIPNGYDPRIIKYMDKEEARRNLNLPLEKKIIFNLAELLPVKGQKYLIEAMKTVSHERDDVICLIGGNGPLKGILEQQIKRLGLGDHVKLVGRIPHSEVFSWYSAADIFVLPSISEASACVVIEAMACGKPVVATNNHGSEDIIISDDFGFLCDSANSQQLTKNILSALNKDWNTDKIRSYAEKFTWENNAKQTVKLFESIIGVKPSKLTKSYE